MGLPTRAKIYVILLGLLAIASIAYFASGISALTSSQILAFCLFLVLGFPDTSGQRHLEGSLQTVRILGVDIGAACRGDDFAKFFAGRRLAQQAAAPYGRQADQDTRYTRDGPYCNGTALGDASVPSDKARVKFILQLQ